MKRQPLFFVGLCALLGLAAAFSSTHYSVAQEQIRLRDVSGSASPIRVSGYVTLSDDPSKITRYSYQVVGSFTNISNKGVSLVVIRFRTSGGSAPGLDYSYQQEYFFTDHDLESGVSESVDNSLPSFSAPIANGVPLVESSDSPNSRRKATAEVEFVQFRDGLTWGDRETARDVLKDRRAILRELRALERTYAESGEQALWDELSKQTTLPDIISLQSRCKDRGDYSRCAVDKLHEMLEAARNHERTTRSEAPSPANRLP